MQRSPQLTSYLSEERKPDLSERNESQKLFNNVIMKKASESWPLQN